MSRNWGSFKTGFRASLEGLRIQGRLRVDVIRCFRQLAGPVSWSLYAGSSCFGSVLGAPDC